MFTGLVEDLGAVRRVERWSDAAVLVVAPNRLPLSELSLGESVAINGVCLTVTEIGARDFTVLAGAETLRRTTIGELRAQSPVNLERAMRASDRFGGHMVAGHVDGVGEVRARRDRGANLEIDVSADSGIMRYVIEKGSIAIDGISLTVNLLVRAGFSVALIPHTVAETTLGARPVGSKVNLEVDLVGKYVEKLVEGYRTGGST